MSSKTARSWGFLTGHRIRTSSFADESWSLKTLSRNPGTKEKPTYIHADSITIKGTVVTLVVGARTFTSDEIEFNNVAKEYGVRNREKPVSYYYFDVKDESTGRHLRIWVTEKEMHNALLK